MLGINLNISMADILSPLGAFLSQYVTRTNNNQHLRLMENMRDTFLFLCVSVVKLRRLTWFCKKLTIVMPKYFMKKKMQISLSASAPE